MCEQIFSVKFEAQPHKLTVFPNKNSCQKTSFCTVTQRAEFHF
jgi:hypothetical protein